MPIFAVNRNDMKTKATVLEFDKLIESKVGMTMDEIRSQSSDKIVRHIEKLATRKLDIGAPARNLSYRGNMLLALGKITKNIDGLFDSTFSVMK